PPRDQGPHVAGPARPRDRPRHGARGEQPLRLERGHGRGPRRVRGEAQAEVHRAVTPPTASRELGAWGAERRLEVDAARLAAYAAAIDDPAPEHRAGAAAGPLLALAAAIPALLEAGFAALP